MFSACLSYLSSHLEGEVSWDLPLNKYQSQVVSKGSLAEKTDISQVSLSSVREVEECLPFEGC